MTDVNVEVEEATDDSPDVVVVENDASDVVMDATTIDLVERITRAEDTLTLLAAAVDELTTRVGMLAVTDEIQQEEIDATQEVVAEVATEAADAVETVAEEVEQASEEIKPEEVPATREHPFFRKWGRK